MPRSLRTRQCSHSARPSAVWTPRPWTKSCSANSPSCSSWAISSVTSSPTVTACSATTSSSPLSFGRKKSARQRRSPFGWRGQYEALELGLAVLGVEHDDVVALGVAREVAEQRARVQVVRLAPHALQARAEVVLEQPLPLLALHAAPAPVQLEQHVRVEVRVELVAVDLDLAHAPERRLGDRRRRSRPALRTESSVVSSSSTSSPLLAERRRPRRGSSSTSALARARARSAGPSPPGPRTRPCSRRRPAS